MVEFLEAVFVVEKAFDALAVFDTRRIMNFMTMMSSEVLTGRSDLAYGTRARAKWWSPILLPSGPGSLAKTPLLEILYQILYRDLAQIYLAEIMPRGRCPGHQGRGEKTGRGRRSDCVINLAEAEEVNLRLLASDRVRSASALHSLRC
eukprot:s1256_g2.t1